MPTYRVRATINGVTKRSWGDSVDEAASRREAQAQLDKLYGPGVAKIIEVTEIPSREADSEFILMGLLGAPVDHVPD